MSKEAKIPDDLIAQVIDCKWVQLPWDRPWKLILCSPDAQGYTCACSPATIYFKMFYVNKVVYYVGQCSRCLHIGYRYG